MWKWLGTVFGWALTAVGGPDISVLHDVVHGVWGWISRVFGHVGKAWHNMFNAGGWIHLALAHFGLESLAAVWDIIFIRIPRVVSWAWNHLQRLWVFATRIADNLKRAIIDLILRIAVAVHNAIRWVRDHVWVPLKALIDTALKWIRTAGELVFYYITHPDKLAALIFDSLIALLEREAWNIGDKLGKFFLALIVHNLRHFVNLLEDILMAVF